MRSRVELALRITALIALAAWIALAARPSANRREDVRSEALPTALPRWTRGADADVDSVHVQLDTVPDASTLAWLRALRGAGVGVAWSAPSVRDVAIETYAAADPSGGVFVLASMQPRETRIVSDALGPIDTLGTAAGAVRLASVEGAIA